jgi:hypothetical protein|tara:strand:+ start:798 stop:1055 length:258 start_codon:yes stop_codon:yes gene_type:complete
VKSKLLVGCKTVKEKKNRIAYFKEHNKIFEVLLDYLKQEERLLEGESGSKNRYDNPNWGYQQADYNGSKRTYNDFITTLESITNG